MFIIVYFIPFNFISGFIATANSFRVTPTTSPGMKTMTVADALSRALWSALHCPEDYRSKFIELAEEFAEGITDRQIDRCIEVALNMESPNED
jgi:hypothetical protein